MKMLDLTGQTFGKLTVVARAENVVSPNGTAKTMWLCKCECGNEVVRSSQNIRSGKYVSCGCWRAEYTSEHKLQDITGQRFGRLVVIGREQNKETNPLTRWRCRCDCGNEIVAYGNNLKRGHTTSCGCWRNQLRPIVHTTHGMRHSRIYGVYGKIKGRCTNPNTPCYERYGGRGIKMCEEWMNDPEAFIKWAYENGYDENAKYGECTIDRIDVNGNYEPSNCRWITNLEQQNNRRNNRRFDYNGETKTIAEWSRELNVSYGVMQNWLVKKGKSIEDFINDYTPKKRS